jgi:hypothetical protein
MADHLALRRFAVLAALVGIGWVLTKNRNAKRTLVAPTIGGDTWPPVPVKPSVDG